MEKFKMKLYILGSGLYTEEVADYIISSGTHHLSGFIEGQDKEKCSHKLLERDIVD